MIDNPLSGIDLTSESRAALEQALAERNGYPLSSFAILRAVIAVDTAGDWAWVQVHTRPLQDDDVIRYVDHCEIAQWQGEQITKYAADGLRAAARMARMYDLLPMPPAVLALGVLWEPNTGAVRSFLEGSSLTHVELLALVQDAVLGMRLESLADAMESQSEQSPAPDARGVSPRLAQLEPLLREVARCAGSDQVRGTYVTISTAGVMMAAIPAHRAVWEKASAAAHVSLDAYEANLRWASSHPTEVISSNEDDVDQHLEGIRLTEELSVAIDRACRAATAIAGTERPDVLRVLPIAILSVVSADARRGIREQDLIALQSELVTASLGGTVPDLAVYFASADTTQKTTDGKRTESEQAQQSAQPPTKKREAITFRIGTFIGALIVAIFGGIPIIVAFWLAMLVQFVAERSRKRPRSRKMLASVAAVVMVVAVGLAATVTPDFADDVKAVSKLKEGQAAINRQDPIAAMPLIAQANLLENESVRAQILSACIDWDLKFRDWALYTLQYALNLGFKPGEPSHYRGRGCFIDNPVSGIDYLKAEGPSGWLLFPRPNNDDAAGQRYLEIAIRERNQNRAETHLALACLADRYDMRSLAGFNLTVGVGIVVGTNSGPSAYPEIRKCIKSIMMSKRYMSYRKTEMNADVYVPSDPFVRIPSPKKPRPPTDACWAKFPAGKPCNADE